MVSPVISFGSLSLILFDLLGAITESSLEVGLASPGAPELDSELGSVLLGPGAWAFVGFGLRRLEPGVELLSDSGIASTS